LLLSSSPQNTCLPPRVYLTFSIQRASARGTDDRSLSSAAVASVDQRVAQLLSAVRLTYYIMRATGAGTSGDRRIIAKAYRNWPARKRALSIRADPITADLCTFGGDNRALTMCRHMEINDRRGMRSAGKKKNEMK